ncbi:MAG: hypothetical protein KBD78_01065 [Oligoflexales bacterium]|nr:hypothetical protein [Oligoflexales bacterium]
MKMNAAYCLTLLTSGFLLNCGGSKSKSAASQQSYVDVTVELEKKESSLALLAAGTYSAAITGCVSGFTKSGITEATTSVQVPAGDHDCVFKLSTFVLNGENFAADIGQSFAAGTSFILTGSQGTNLEFVVNSNLASPIVGAQSVNMTFSTITSGGPIIVSPSAAAGISISGSDPIDLEIGSASATIDANDGAGIFTVVLDCASNIASGLCNGISLATMKSNIVLDSFGGDLDLAECLTVANAGAVGSIVNVGHASAPHGGLSTAAKKGPAPMYGAGNGALILAVSSAAGACKYFQISVVAP